jgi:alginate O-acetyltransferase complex protein AlgI
MLFLEPWFWIFAVVVVPGYWVCPRRLKAYGLLAASAVFHYHFAGPAGMAPILVLACLTYVVGLGALRLPRVSPSALVVVLIVGALSFYKYSEFLVENARALFGVVQVAVPAWMMSWSSPAAPLGISFFTFEFVHYLYEVRVRGREPVRNPVHFGIFAIFFPSLAAGPIKRFPDFVPQLEALRNPRFEDARKGAQRVIRGLFKKVCIADLLVAYIEVLETFPYNGPIVASLAVMQGLRIYYDFSGYSDMAIGLGRMVNLKLPENFDRPYGVDSLREFWRRWHMSLSYWIRDYIYIPLGGNRAHRALNLLVTMALCGLWHGASWNLAIWGVYHGMGLVTETGVQRLWPRLFAGGLALRLLRWAVCYLFVMYGWLLFFYPIDTVWQMTLALGDWSVLWSVLQ